MSDYSVLKSGVCAAMAVVVDLAVNVSRGLADHASLVLLTKVSKKGVVSVVPDPKFIELIMAINSSDQGFDMGKDALVLVKTTKAAAKAAHKGLIEALSEVDWGKTLSYGEGKHLTGKDIKDYYHGRKAPVVVGAALSGSSRRAAMAIDAVLRDLQGREEALLVKYELRSYGSLEAQVSDCIKLNEDRSVGVRNTSPQQKLNALYLLQEMGVLRKKQWRKRFPSVKPGVFQQITEPLLWETYLRLVGEDDLADEFRAWNKGTDAIMSQQFVTNQRPLVRRPLEFKGGRTAVSADFCGVGGDSAVLTQVAENLEKHPKLIEPMIVVIKALMATGDQKLPARIKAMKREDILSRAKQIGGIAADLYNGIANDDSGACHRGERAIAILVERAKGETIFLPDDEGGLSAVPATQKDFNALLGIEVTG